MIFTMVKEEFDGGLTVPELGGEENLKKAIEVMAGQGEEVYLKKDMIEVIAGQGEEEYLKKEEIEVIASQGEEEYLKKEVLVGQGEKEIEVIADQREEMKAKVLGEVKHPRTETKQISRQVKEEIRIGGGGETEEERQEVGGQVNEEIGGGGEVEEEIHGDDSAN
ncbi:hypothetical protein M5689_008269 [Euphorbia peplus]|nr:hypothetical protein M5689_008269 [Euphorbia peplus]